jgi:hypothetical protein
MNISSVGMNSLANSLHSARKDTYQAAATSTLKSAMQTPEQFMALLDASISVQNATAISNATGIGSGIDVTV